MNPKYNRRMDVANKFARTWATSHHYSTEDAATTEYEAAADAMRDALDAVNGRPALTGQSRYVIFGNITERLSFVHRLGPIAADQLADAAIDAAIEDANALAHAR